MSMTINNNLPILVMKAPICLLRTNKKFPMLDAEEEYMLAKNWKTTGNIKSVKISN